METLEQRLQQLGIELPASPKPVGTYVPGVVTGNLLFMSGCGPRRADGTLISGKVGTALSEQDGYEAARLTGLNMLANIRSVLGSLDRVQRVVKTLGMVNCASDFGAMPKVINGFSDLFVQVFGEERGKGARSAVGMGSLPGQMAVEVEMIVEVRP